MCKFWSCIVDFDGNVYHNPMSDNHSDITLPENLTDNTADKKEMQFAKIEIAPTDENVFSDQKKWILRIDEERKPEWWSEFHVKQCRTELKHFLSASLFVGKEIDKIETGRVWIKDCKIDTLSGNVIVVQLSGTSQVGEMRGTSRVGEMRGTSRVGEMRGTSQVGEMRGTSQVGVMRGTSRVGEMWETSQVGVMWETSQVGVMWETSRVGEMWGTSRVGEMRGTSQVGVMRGNAIAIIPGDKYRIIVADNDKFTIEKHIKK